MRVTLCLIAVALLVITASGCQRVEPTPPQLPTYQQPLPVPAPAPAPPPAKEPEPVLPVAEDVGPAPIEVDAQVAEALRAEASRLIADNQADKADSVLAQLSEVVECMKAEVPARQILQYLQRTKLFLADGDMAGASRELQRAQYALLTGRPAQMQPEVLSEITTAKKKVDSGDPAGCKTAVEALIAKLRTASEPDKDPIVKLDKVTASIANTREATQRGAYKVAQAELAFMQEILQGLVPKRAPAPAPKPAVETTEGGAPEAEKPAAGATTTPTPEAPTPPAPAPPATAGQESGGGAEGTPPSPPPAPAAPPAPVAAPTGT